MEIYAGFVEHVDVQAGRLIDELERLGVRDNTIVIYIFGDNGASAEGQNGTISELLAQNGIPNTVEQQIAALEKIGGLDALGSPKTDSMYNAGWAWAGNTPFRYTKLVASHFGGTRNPMVISWPKGIKADRTPRAQFSHVNDIVPTLYEIVGIKPPKVVDGFAQDPIDGTSLVYTFADAKAPTRKHVQYFDNNGSRAIWQDGWVAATFGPLVPWLPGAPGLAEWDSAKDKWELYDIARDFSEADDLAAKDPKRLAQLQKTFDEQAKANKVYPLGAGIWLRLHPEDRIKSPYTHWRFDATSTRMPEFTAPGLGRENSTVDDRCGDRRQRLRRSLCAGRLGRRPRAVHGQGNARLRVQHDDHRAHDRALCDEGCVGQASHRGDHDAGERQAAVPGRRRAEGRRAGGRAHDRAAHGARRVLGQRDVRRWRGPRLARLARLLRPAAVQVRRDDQQRGRDGEVMRASTVDDYCTHRSTGNEEPFLDRPSGWPRWR